MAGPLHATRLYKRNRRLLLSGNPTCTLQTRCEGAPATTADFIIPESLGGTADLTNLRPACRSCNSSRGNRTKQKHSLKW